MIHDGEDYNPLFEIYTESIPADILKQYRDRIVSDLVNDKETKAHKQLSHLKKKGVPLRIKDVLFVEDSTRVDQSTFTSRLAEENEQFAQVQRVIRKYREKDGLVQKGENTEVAQVAVGDDVLETLDTSDAIEETNEIRFDEPKVALNDVLTAEQEENIRNVEAGVKQSSPPPLDPNQKGSDVSARAESFAGQEIQIKGGSFKLNDLNGNYILGMGGRAWVQVIINGTPVNFYQSTGLGGKVLQPGRFYPTVGVTLMVL